MHKSIAGANSALLPRGANMRAIGIGIVVLLMMYANGGIARADAAPPPGVRFVGRVVDAGTQRPIAGASVLLRELRRGAITHADGRFELDGVPIGAYTLVVSAVGYGTLERRIELLADHEQTLMLEPRPIVGAEVTVTARHDDAAGSAHAVTTITPVDLERTRGQTLGEALKNVPGVSLLQTGPSIAKPVIRGLHSQRVLLVNAGVAQEGQQWGGEHAPEIDPFAPTGIEVIRGAAGVEYGAGAIGGVIRLQPRPLPDSAGLAGELALNGFSNNRQGAASLTVEGMPAAVPGAGLRLQASARRAGDSRTADYGIGNTGFAELNGSLLAGYHHAGLGVDVYASHFGTELGIYRGSHVRTLADLQQAIALGRPDADYPFSYHIDPPKQEITHDLISVTGHYAVPDVGRIEAQYGYQYNHRLEYDAHNVRVVNDSGASSSERASFELGLRTQSGSLKLRHDPFLGLLGTIGLEGAMQQNTRGGTIKLIPNFIARNASAFLIENAQLGDVTLDAGLRYDYRSVRVYAIPSRHIPDGTHTYTSFSGAAGAVYQIDPEWSIGSTIGTAWRPPSVNELYSNDVHHGSAQFEIGDPTMHNERSYSVDATLKHVGGALHLEASAYFNTIDGYIYLLPDPQPTVTIRGTYPVFRYRQTNARLYGVDGSVDYQAVGPLRLGATLSIVRGDNRTSGEPLIQMPGDRLRVYAHADFNDPAPWLLAPFVEISVLGVRRQDRYPAGQDYAAPPPGYALLDVDAGGRFVAFGTEVHASLSVDNVLNHAYRDYLSRFRYFTDDPGRNIVVRLTIPFGARR